MKLGMGGIWTWDTGTEHRYDGLGKEDKSTINRESLTDRACLRIYDDFADAMSIADLCSGSAFAPDNEVRRSSPFFT